MPVAAALVGLLLAFTTVGNSLDLAADDFQSRLLAPNEVSTDVLVFDIDDASLARLRPLFGSWPFSRDVYALAIELLRDAGARAVTLDLLFSDKSAADAALAQAIARPGAPVMLAAAGVQHASDELHAERQALAGTAVRPAVSSPPGRVWPALALPAPSLWPPNGRPWFGVITTPLDNDGVLRSLPLWHQDGRVRLPSLPLALHEVLEPNAPPPRMDHVGGWRIAMPRQAHLPVTLPFSDLVAAALGQSEATELRAAVAGRVVFIGSSALLADTVITPRGQVSGTQVLAQTYSAMKRGQDILPQQPWLNAALLALALVPGALAMARGRLKAARDAINSAWALLAMAALAATALWLWRQPSAWVPALGALATGLGMAWWMAQRAQVEARFRLDRELEYMAAAARAKSSFLANVSHEIRTPLSALLGVAELLGRTPLNAQQRLHVQVFKESGQTLHTLINDLLDLSKVEAGRLDVHRAPFDLHELLRQLGELMQGPAEDKGIDLHIELAPDVPALVLGDRLRLQQCLVNLLGNAIKFTARGNVSLKVSPAAKDAIETSAETANASKTLCFVVKDTGIGIAADQLEAVFEPFAQADGSVTRIYGGTGLGLAITRSVVSLMGGMVQVHSTPGQGSTFSLRLPLPVVALPAQALEPAPGAQRVALDTALHTALANEPPLPAWADGSQGSATLQVLLAEDNEINVYIFRSMMEGLPLELHHANNGPAALEQLRQRAFDIAFIDVQMPGMDGLTLTRELRKLEAFGQRQRTPVVALTAHAFDTDLQASLAAGCDRHLAKPVTRATLVRAIDELTGPTRARAEAQPEIHPQNQPKNHLKTADFLSSPSASLPLAIDRQAAQQRLGGNATLHNELCAQASDFMADWAPRFEQALASQQTEAAYRLAHDLNGVATTIGAATLARRAAALEKSLWKAAPGARPGVQLQQQALVELATVMAELQRYAAEPSLTSTEKG